MVAKDLHRAGVSVSSIQRVGLYLRVGYPVECGNLALWQEPGTARSRAAIPADGRLGHPGRYRPCWPWYRCSRRQLGHQLPDGQHDRGICSSYWYVARAPAIGCLSTYSFLAFQVVPVVLENKERQSPSSTTTTTRSCTYCSFLLVIFAGMPYRHYTCARVIATRGLSFMCRIPHHSVLMTRLPIQQVRSQTRYAQLRYHALER